MEGQIDPSPSHVFQLSELEISFTSKGDRPV